MAEMRYGNIEKLGHTNYISWKFEMKMLLIREDLWSYVETATPEERLQTAEWKRGNSKALATIALGCEKSQFALIRACILARDAWVKLHKHHEQRTILSKVTLIKRICSKRLEEGGNMEAHLQEFDDIFQRCDDGEMVFADLFKVVFVLASLPESYETLVVALESRRESELTLSFIKQKLIDEFERQKAKANVDGDDQLMLVRNKRFEKKRDGCWHCGAVDHLRRNCPKFQAESRPRANFARDDDVNDEPVTFMASTDACDDGWYVDSGATRHMCKDKAKFNCLKVGTGSNILMANGVRIPEEGRGRVQLVCENDGGRRQEILIEEVLYAPKLDANLVSVSKLLSRGFTVNFETNRCTISKDNRLVATAVLDKGLFRLLEAESVMLAGHKGHTENCKHQWHRKLGHRDFNAIVKVQQQNLATGFKIEDCSVEERCECCLEAKLTRLPFPSAVEKKTTRILEIIHSDLCGPISPSSFGGSRYVMTLIDDYSCYSRIFLLKVKSEAATRIKEFVAEMQTRFGRKPQVIRSDRGGEYTGKDLLKFYRENGITPQFTVPYSPQQNGKAERKNRYLVEMTRCLLSDSRLQRQFWGEAMMTANYLQNRLPTSASDYTPYELWHGQKPDYSTMRIFGCRAWVQVPRVKRSKLDPAAVCMTFVGYATQQKGYRFWNPRERKIVISRDASFLELDNGSSTNAMQPIVSESPPTLCLDHLNSLDEDGRDVESVPVQEERQDVQPMEPMSSTVTQQEPILRRSTRTNRGVVDPFLSENYLLYYAVGEVEDEPRSYQEAINSHDHAEWREAMKEEMTALKSNHTWELTDRPEGRNVVGCKWVFKRKHDEEGKPTRFRARLVAQGFSQKYGVDFDEVFAPVVKATTVRIMLAIAGIEKLTVRHVDVKTAFLNGDLDEEIYMKQPPGFLDPDYPEKVCLLKKSLYGLKQSARRWCVKLCDVLESMGFTRSTEDECLFTKTVDGRTIYILCYVDDILLIGADEEELVRIEEELRTHFEIVSLGNAHHFLGMRLTRDNDGFFALDQSAYISRILTRFNMLDAKPSKIPLDPSYLSESDTSEPFLQETMYRSLIGALLYLSISTRPDVATAASMLSRKLSCPTLRDWNEAKRVLRYLKGSIDLSLKLGHKDYDRRSDLIGFIDADHAGDINDRKSNSGFVFLFRGAPISWGCHKQTTVSISSTEAEYVSLSEACQESVAIRRFLDEVDYKQKNPTLVFEDNQSCIQLASCERIGRRSKHIETRYHYVRDLNETNIIDLNYCPTEDMVADIMTKPLGANKMAKFRALMRLQLRDGADNLEEEC